jgi:hypothetical protein
VLDALARALQLDKAERAHLFNLAQGAKARAGARTAAQGSSGCDGSSTR